MLGQFEEKTTPFTAIFFPSDIFVGHFLRLYRMTDSPLYAIQITDTHLFADPEAQLLGVSTQQTLQVVVEKLAGLTPQPDIVLATGDLSQDGSVESYQRLRQLLGQLQGDIYWLAGNHDRLPEMELALGAGADSVLADKAFVRNGWRFVLLNSATPGQVSGWLAADELERLREQLQVATDRQERVAVFLHHPPISMKSQWLDTSRLENYEALCDVLAQFHCVRVVLFGHVHQAGEFRQNEIAFMACPSTCVQFEPQSQQFAIDSNAPGVRQLWFYPDGRFETKVMRIAEATFAGDPLAAGY